MNAPFAFTMFGLNLDGESLVAVLGVATGLFFLVTIALIICAIKAGRAEKPVARKT